MTKPYKKFWLFAWLLTLLLLAATTVLWPRQAGWLSLGVFSAGVGMALFFALRPAWRGYRAGQLDRRALARALLINATGLLLTLLIAIAAGGWAGRLAGQSAWEAGWPVWSVVAVSLLAGFAAGWTSGWLARSAWTWLLNRSRLDPART